MIDARRQRAGRWRHVCGQRAWLPGVALLGALAATMSGTAGCDSLQHIAVSVCGNDVIEEGEDCEHIGVSEEDGFHCGAVGTSNECRWLCDPDKPSSDDCPTGFGCGTDGICRRPSGALLAPAPHAIPPGLWLGSGDFDGDGSDDIAWAHANYSRVDFMQNGAPVSAAENFQNLVGWPAIGDANDDTRADLLLPTEDGLAVFRGSVERTLLTTTFASTRFPLQEPFIVPVDAIPDVVLTPSGPPRLFFGEEVMALVTGHIEMLLPAFMTPPAPIAGDISKLARPFVVGEFDEFGDPALYPAAGPTPEELVLAFEGDDHATLYRPEVTDLDEAQPRLDLLARPPIEVHTSGLPVIRLLGAVHANPIAAGGSLSALPCAGTNAIGDEHLDLALLTIAATDGEGQPLYSVEIGFGIGDGRFHSDPCQLDQVPASITPNNATAPMALFASCTDALAVAHLDHDGLLDVVTPRGIWQSWLLGIQPGEPLPSHCQPTSLRYQPGDPLVQWREVVIGDMNQDGTQDLAIAPDGGGLDLYLGSSSGVLTHSTRPGLGRLRSLTMGDYDGDNNEDVAFIEDVDGPDRISVVFGEALANPSDVVEVGALDGVSVMLAFDRAGAGAAADNAEELGIQVNDEEGVQVATFFGRTDRQLTAPFVPTYLDGEGITTVLPFASAVGSLSGSGPPHVAMVSPEFVGDDQFIFSAGAATTDGDLTFSIVPNRVALMAGGLESRLGLELIAGGDGRDKMVIVTSPELTPESSAHILVEMAELDFPSGDPDASSLLAGQGSISIPGFTTIDDVLQASRTTAVCDVGRADGAALFIQARQVQLCEDGVDIGASTMLMVTRPMLEAALEGSSQQLDNATAFAFPAGSRMTGFACLNADADAADEVAMLVVSAPSSCGDSDTVAGASLWLLDFDADGNTLPAVEWRRYDAAALAALTDLDADGPVLASLAAGDFNGDGVEDLAAGASEATVIWLAEPWIR